MTYPAYVIRWLAADLGRMIPLHLQPIGGSNMYQDKMVRIDVDNEEWGRVVGQATVIEDRGDTLLVSVNTIRANIVIDSYELTDAQLAYLRD